jgi:multiple sugar transport system ATP-binding protein
MLPPPVRAAAAEAGLGEVVLGVRPEDIELGIEPGIAGLVQTLEHLGADAHVRCTVATDGREDTIVARCDGARAPRPGDAIVLALADGDLHWFSPRSGERLPDGR